MLDLLTSPAAWVSFVTLVALEIVLGIDNIVFITILSGKLPRSQQHRARRLGLGLALITRLMLLSTLSYVAKLTEPLFVALGFEASGRDLILIFGGLFLIVKATMEIYDKVEAEHEEEVGSVGRRVSFGMVLVQIMLLDVVFSLDSVITAIGMVQELAIMAAAVVAAVAVMMVFAGAVGDFVERHPSVKILALAFLVMIGVLLLAEGFHRHFDKGFVYFSMAFSLFIEVLNMRYRKRLHELETKVSVLHQTG
jgi:predicted tellurium resistance membrane protein TerC